MAIVGAHRGFTVREQPRDGTVAIVARRDLTRHLGELPPVLGEPSVARIYDVARHLSTWQPGTVRRAEFHHSP